MKHYCIENLQEIKKFLVKLDKETYRMKLDFLSGASIGQHVRHILEFYQVVLEGIPKGVINYDKRRRNKEIEELIDFAGKTIEIIILQLESIEKDLILILNGDFSNEGQDQITEIKTTLYRELAYNLEHSIHHQSLIRVGCHVLNLDSELPENFGVAPATLKNRKKTKFKLLKIPKL